jgi:hypothetical protein
MTDEDVYFCMGSALVAASMLLFLVWAVCVIPTF